MNARPTRGGGVRLALDADEAAIVRVLAMQTVELLRPDGDADGSAPAADSLEALAGVGDPVPAPADPAVRRLLPDAYGAGNEPDAEEFRRLTDDQLRRAKTAALDEVVAALAPTASASVTVTLDADAAEQWLQALNDVRLVLGSRLDVQEDDPRWEQLPTDQDELGMLLAYELVTVLQQRILDALDG